MTNRHLTLFLTYLLSLLLLVACNTGGSDDNNFLQGGQSQAICFEVTAQNLQGNALPKGPDALGGIGDFVLTNGNVHFVVDGGVLGSRGQHHLSPTGGTLIDATFARENRDQLNQLSQIINFDNNMPVVALAFRILSTGETVCSLEVTGGVIDSLGSLGGGLVRDPATGLVIGLEVVTTYTLEIGARHLNIQTTVNNLTGQVVPIFSIANLCFTGTRSMKPFFPFPTRGLFQPPLTLPPAPSAFTFVPAIGLSGSHERGAEINYSICSAESGVMLAVSDGSEPNEARFFAFGNPGTFADSIPPADSLTFTRQFFVGTPDLGSGVSNGSSASLGAAYEHLAANSLNPLNIIQRTGEIRGVVEPVQKGADILFVQTSPALFFDGAGFSDFSALGGIPMSHAVSQDNGAFQAALPPGTYTLFIDAPGRPQSVVSGIEVFSDRIISLGIVDLLGEDPENITFRMTDSATGNLIPGKVTVKGTGTTLDPDFGRRNLASGDRNVIYTRSGFGNIPLNSGTYEVFFSRGMEWNVVSALITVPGTGSIDAVLTHEVDSFGFISADFHIHAEGSFDSSVPVPDRVDSIVGEGLEVAVASEHDKISDWQNQIFLSQITPYARAYTGLEATSNIPAVSNGLFPVTIGHWISFPQRLRPEAGGNGAIQDEFIQPGLLMDLLASNTEFVGNIFVDPVPGTVRGYTGVPMMLAHPNTAPVGPLGIGYHANFGYDPTSPLSAAANAFYTAPILNPTTGLPITATRNLDYNMLEVLSGPSQSEYLATRTDWFSFLNQGEFKTAVGVSDSHDLVTPVGFPRTYVIVNDDSPLTMGDGDFIGSLLDGNGFATNGPFVRFDIGGVLPGQMVGGPNATVTLSIDVQAPNWVNTTAVNIYRNGVAIATLPIIATTTTRFSGTVTVDVDPAIGDSYYVVEVVGDVSDTYSIIAPDHAPTAITNPIFVDEDGNGNWEAPGL